VLPADSQSPWAACECYIELVWLHSRLAVVLILVQLPPTEPCELLISEILALLCIWSISHEALMQENLCGEIKSNLISMLPLSMAAGGIKQSACLHGYCVCVCAWVCLWVRFSSLYFLYKCMFLKLITIAHYQVHITRMTFSRSLWVTGQGHLVMSMEILRTR